jgi:hypothetical protein
MKESKFGQKEKSNSPRVVEGRHSYLEDDGKIQSRRYQNSQGIEAHTGRNECHGSKTRGVPEHSWMKGVLPKKIVLLGFASRISIAGQVPGEPPGLLAVCHLSCSPLSAVPAGVCF